MRSLRLIRCAGVLVLLATAAYADIYTCPDSRGRTIYQDQPCNGAAPVVTSRPQAPPASPAPPPPRATGAPSPAETQPPLPAAPSVRAPTAAPVDQGKFAFIAPGMREQDVLQRLGAPGHVEEQPAVLRRVGRDYIAIRRTVWVYPGDGFSMTRFLAFENGVLVAKRDRH